MPDPARCGPFRLLRSWTMAWRLWMPASSLRASPLPGRGTEPVHPLGRNTWHTRTPRDSSGAPACRRRQPGIMGGHKSHRTDIRRK